MVTGGSKGIGLAVVRELYELGAKIFVVGRTFPALDEVISNFNLSADRIEGMLADVSKLEDRARIVDAIGSKWVNSIYL